MPCSVDLTLEEKCHAYVKRASEATRLLCYACRNLIDMEEASKELQGWWVRHQQEDQRRLEREEKERLAKQKEEEEKRQARLQRARLAQEEAHKRELAQKVADEKLTDEERQLLKKYYK